jgi:hypothetical protein
MLVVATVSLATPALAFRDPRDTRGTFDISSIGGVRRTIGYPHAHGTTYYAFNMQTFDPITDEAANHGSIRVFVDIEGSRAPDFVIRPVGRWVDGSAHAVLINRSTHNRTNAWAWLRNGSFRLKVNPAQLDSGDRTPRYFILASDGTQAGTDRAPNAGWKTVSIST